MREPLSPDDITDEEAAAARSETTAQGLTAEQVEWRVRKLCAAQNALRDERVRADERERIARSLESTSGGNPRAFVSDIAVAIREGGRDAS